MAVEVNETKGISKYFIENDPYAIPVSSMLAQISKGVRERLYKEGSDEFPPNFEE